MTATAVIKKLKEQFSRHGIHKTVFSDNGSSFVCREFKEFERGWEFKHSTNSLLCIPSQMERSKTPSKRADEEGFAIER